MIVFLIVVALVLLIFLFWQISHLTSLIFGTPFVKTPKEQIKRAFRMVDLKSNEMVYDLGAGDGSVLITAVRDFKSRALGFEISPFYYLLCHLNLKRAKINPRARVIFQDFKKVDLNKTDVIYLYLMPKVIQDLEEKFKNLRKGIKIVSFKFPIEYLKPLKQERELYVYKI